MAWYTKVLGVERYVSRPGPDGDAAYVEFRREDSDFDTASVVEPFGNLLGVMYNPHYLDVLASIRQA